MIEGNRIVAKLSRAKAQFNDLWCQNSGASLVEFALIVPFLISLMIGIVEMSNVFYTRNILNEHVRDATRRFAVGALDESETKKLIRKKLAQTIDAEAEIWVTETEDEGDNTDVTVGLSVRLQDLLLFNNLSGGLITFAGARPYITLSATMLKY